MRKVAIAGVLGVSLSTSAPAGADTHAGVSLGGGVFGLDTISDGHGPAGTGTALAADGVALVDLNRWLRGGAGVGYRFLTGGSTTSWRPGHLLDVDALLQGRIGVAAGEATLTVGASYAWARYRGDVFDLTAHGTMATVRVGYQRPVGAGRAWMVELIARTPTSAWSMRIESDHDYWGDAPHAAATLTLDAGVLFDL